MKTIKTIILLLLTVTVLGCTRGVIKTENIAELTGKIIDRHDRYIQKDTTINQVKRNDLLILSFNARQGVEQKEVRADELGFFLWPLLIRHDAYIENDKTLKKVLKRTRLRSSELLRRILLEAGYQGG